MSATDLSRKAWQIPGELRADLLETLRDVMRGKHGETSVRGVVEAPGLRISWDGHGVMFVRWGEMRSRDTIMVSGRSRWKSLAERLEMMIESENTTVECRLKLKVHAWPHVEVELDDDDLERMAGALEQMYQHTIHVELTREEAG